MSNSTPEFWDINGVSLRNCKKCLAAKPESEFYLRFSKARQKHYFHSWCKDCCAQDRRDRVEKDPEYRRNYYLQNTYGLSREAYEAKVEEQGGACAICKQAPGEDGFHVDHDHSCCPGKKSCGKCVRSLLCSYCNRFLGKLESPEVQKFYDYQERWKR